MLNQSVRYAPIARLADDVPGTTLLEVGSGSRGIVRYIADRWQITACDTSFDDYGSRRAAASDRRTTRVVGSVLDLPFADATFDVVVALDLIEHISPDERATALSELKRVCRGRLVVACPSGPRALDADERLANTYRQRGRAVPGWLEEHIVNGFPIRDELVTPLADEGRVRVFINESLIAHATLMRAEITPVLSTACELADRIMRRMLRAGGRRRQVAAATLWVLRGGDRGAGYRALVVWDNAGDPLVSATRS